ncbi:hypothetical protein [Streptomyces sp. CA-132043]|uniref:hypothetical protein n=1 Tax=Streptomyces sp. CA-132043 TaxID=3240048 RepID=UPI003D8B1A1D
MSCSFAALAASSMQALPREHHTFWQVSVRERKIPHDTSVQTPRDSRAQVSTGRKESDGSGSRLLERLRAAIRLHYPEEYERLDISSATFYRLLERLGVSPASLRRPTQQRIDEANLPVPPYTPTTASMLGEQVQIDSTGLDVLALGDDGRPVQLELTAAIDVVTRSIIGALIVPKSPGRGPRGKRLGGRATKSFDAVLMLAQALAPMPGRPGGRRWRWPRAPSCPTPTWWRAIRGWPARRRGR